MTALKPACSLAPSDTRLNSEKIVTTKDDVHRVPVVEHCPPDVTAQRWFLSNRRPEKWRLQPESRIKLPVQTDGSAASLTSLLVETLNAVASGKSPSWKPAKSPT